jgi:parallel beta-helix repeat protein
MQQNVMPTNGMVITQDTQFAPGLFYLPDGVRIANDNIRVEGAEAGTVIASDKKAGVGLRIEGYAGVTVRNLSFNGYYHGLRCDDCVGLTIENITVRGTYEIEGIDTFLYLWKPVEDADGGGLLFNNVRESVVQGCDMQHQMHGVLLYNCETVKVRRCNASFNSGWGLYLNNTHNSSIEGNQFDFCNRVFRLGDGSTRVEADAAGMVIVKGSSHNVFRRNSCLCGGDGIFLCGYEHPGSITPCNHNLFEHNDCRFSTNNAVESTFSGYNTYRYNNVSQSNYGFWMGYSYGNKLEYNTVVFNRLVGFAIEHAFDFDITNNTIRHNGEGVRLWTRGGAVTDYFPNRRVTYNFRVSGNEIEANRVGFVGDTGEGTTEDDSHDFTLTNNTFRDNRVGAFFGRVRDCKIDNNRFERNVEAAIERKLAYRGGVAIGEQNVYSGNATDLRET